MFSKGGPPFFKLIISRDGPPFYVGSWWFQEGGHPFKLMFSRGGPSFQADDFQRWAPRLYRKLMISRGWPPFYIVNWFFQEVVHLSSYIACKLIISRGGPLPILYANWSFQEVGPLLCFKLIISRGWPPPTYVLWADVRGDPGLNFLYI